MDHARAKALISTGIEDRLAELRRFHPPRRVLEVAGFCALWVGGASLTLAAVPTLPPGVLQGALYGLGLLLSAIALNAFVLLLHEGMHHTLFESPFWNRWVSVVLGATVLMSFSAYRVLHLRHHAYLGDPRDPDDYHNYTKQPLLLWTLHFVRLFTGAFLYILLIPFLACRHGSRSERRQILVEYAFLGLIGSAIGLTLPPSVLLTGWFLPVVLVGFMTNVRGFTQHGITDATDPFLASRSIRAHPLVALCLLNENYHLEHHLFPEVPSYHLQPLHRLLWPRLPRAVTGTSYTGFLGRFLRATLTLDETPIGLTGPAEGGTTRQTRAA